MRKVFSREQVSCTYELTVIVTAYTRLFKLKPGKIPAQRGGSGYKVPPPTEELLAFYSCRRRICFFNGMTPWRKWPTTIQSRFHAERYLGNPYWTQWGEQKKKKRREG